MGKRVLIVDDEAEIVEMLRAVLTGSGCDVDSALDAQSALERIRGTIYDAAILDFNLPDMDGVMLHRQIRQMDQELAGRTIFMSGMLQSDGNLGYYETHSAGFLSKPFTLEEVIKALRDVLENPPAA